MTRSRNSRRGTYNRCKFEDCDICHKNYDKIKKAKQWKRNFLKFDGVLYSHKRKRKTIKTNCINLPHDIGNTRQDYINWTWLKGKPNVKGLYHRYQWQNIHSSLR